MSDAERLADPFNRDTAVQDGGGIFSAGTLNVSNTTIGVGLAGDDFGSRGHQGGGIFTSGTMTLADSTIESNTALGFGGGIFNSGTANVTSSTVAYNTTIYGGGVFSSGRITITNSTISGNITYPPSSSYYYTYSSGQVDGSTATSTTLQGSIVANSSGVPDLYGSISGSNNLVDDYSYSNLGFGNDNITGNPMLGTLGNYGGPTETMPPLSGSPVVGAGASFDDAGGNPITTDQRGFPMPAGSPDIGSVQSGDGTTVPLAPSGLSATIISTSQINLAWTDHAASSQEDIICESTDNGGTFSPIDEMISVAAGASNTYVAENLDAGTRYTFEVISADRYEESIAASVGPVQTFADAPTDLYGTRNGDGSISLSWDDAFGESGFIVQRQANGSGWSQIGTTASGVTSFTDPSPVNAPSNAYRVCAIDDSGNSMFSAVASVATNPDSASGLYAALDPSSGTTVDLSWYAVANADSYILHRSTDPTFSTFTTLTASSNSYSDAGLATDTTYYYQVISVSNAAGDSAPSQTVSVLTAPTAPSGLTAAVVNEAAADQDSINLQWTDNSSTETGFEVFSSNDNGGSWSEIGAPATNAEHFTVTNVYNDGNYAFEVVAVNPTVSGPSNIAHANVTEALPSIPGTGKNIDGNGNDTSWYCDGLPAFYDTTAYIGPGDAPSQALAGPNAPDGTYTYSTTFTIPSNFQDVDQVALQGLFSADNYVSTISLNGSTIEGGDADTTGVTYNHPFSFPAGVVTTGTNTLSLAMVNEYPVDGPLSWATLIASASLTLLPPSPSFPAVSISADVPDATIESDGTVHTGQFTVSRTGSTAAALPVQFFVSNTAVPQVDYTLDTGTPSYGETETALIPAGASSATITLTPQSAFWGSAVAQLSIWGSSLYTIAATDAVMNVTHAELLQIDSNNDGQITSADDSIKDDATLSGKIVTVDDADLNANGTPGFADGYGLLADTTAETGASFTPVQLTLSANVDLANATITFNYSGSNPMDVTRTGDGTAYNPYVYVLPASGAMRLWTEDGTASRDGNPVAGEDGDYIEPGIALTPAQLGLSSSNFSVTLYIEGVKPTSLGAGTIAVTVSADGSSSTDEVRTTVVKVYLAENAGSDNSAGVVDFTSVGAPMSGLRPTTADSGFRIDGADEYYEKLGSGLKWWFAQPGSIPDQATALTDMEDFVPFDLNVPQSVQPFLAAGYTLELRMSYSGDPSDRVEVYPNLSPASNISAYLNTYNAGANGVSQSEAKFISDATASTFNKITLSASSPEGGLSTLRWGESDNPSGIGVGDNELLLRLLDPTGSDTAMIHLSLELRPPKSSQEYAVDTATITAMDIRSFYSMVTALGTPGSPVNSPDSHFYYPTEDRGSAYGPSFSYVVADNHDSAVNQTVVFIHGYNCSPADAIGTFDEEYKRLYWQGFRGNFVGFNWYGNELAPLFDPNVKNALETAPALYLFLRNTLESPAGWDVPAADVDLMAHSLGTLVMYDALRINAAFGLSPVANNAVGIEAAVWADAFQPLPAPGTSLTINFTNNFGFPQTLSLTTSQLEDLTWYGYFSNINASLVSGGGIFNSYLPDDYALQTMRFDDWLFRGIDQSNPGLLNNQATIRSEKDLAGLPTLVQQGGNLNNLFLSGDLPLGETNTVNNPNFKGNFAVSFLETQLGVPNSQPTNWTDNGGTYGGFHSDFVQLAYPKIWNWWSEFLSANKAMAVNAET